MWDLLQEIKTRFHVCGRVCIGHILILFHPTYETWSLVGCGVHSVLEQFSVRLYGVTCLWVCISWTYDTSVLLCVFILFSRENVMMFDYAVILFLSMCVGDVYQCDLCLHFSDWLKTSIFLYYWFDLFPVVQHVYQNSLPFFHVFTYSLSILSHSFFCIVNLPFIGRNSLLVFGCFFLPLGLLIISFE